MLTTPLARALLRAASIATMAFAGNTAMATPVTWDATDSYSLTQDTGVDGVWSYGSTGTVLGGAFTKFSRQRATGTLQRWDFTNTSALIGKAIGGNYYVGSPRIDDNTLMLHPGGGGEFGVLRFIAPVTGSYQVNASFWASDVNTSTDAHIFAAGHEYFSHLVTPTDTHAASNIDWTGTLQLTAGQFIDFAVGWGANRNYTADSTGLDAVVTKLDPVANVPEPSSLLLFGSGLGLAGFLRRRKRS